MISAEDQIELHRKKWESIFGVYSDCTMRLRVPGGWIVKTYERSRDSTSSQAICFFPDPNHEWDPKK